jgi:elongation factor G
VQKALPVVLEPLMSLEVVVPQESVREVIGDINARRGKVLGMEQQTGMAIIAAHVPLAALFGYATALRSLTQGRGTYSMQLYQYVPLSEMELKKVVANS